MVDRKDNEHEDEQESDPYEEEAEEKCPCAAPILVGRCRAAKRRARSRTVGLQARSARDCSIAQALGGAQHSTKELAVPLCDVDAFVLRQSSGAEPVFRSPARHPSGQRRVAQALQAPSNGEEGQARASIGVRPARRVERTEEISKTLRALRRPHHGIRRCSRCPLDRGGASPPRRTRVPRLERACRPLPRTPGIRASWPPPGWSRSD